MHLDELAVGVVCALLEDRRLSRTGADHGVGALAEERAYASRCQNDGIAREGTELHGAKVERGNATTCAPRIEHS